MPIEQLPTRDRDSFFYKLLTFWTDDITIISA